MLIYPFHNDDSQSQLPTRVGFGFGLASKGEITVVGWQIGKQSSEYDRTSSKVRVKNENDLFEGNKSKE